MTLFVALMAFAATASAAEPLPASLDALHSQPQLYAGHRVRLHGQVDACYNFSCNLCPEDSTPSNPQAQRCARMDFDRFGGNRADMRPQFRYADVVLTARFDPTCWSKTVICTDNATVLLDARVEKVTRRRRSNEGLFGRQEKLIHGPEAEAAALIAVARRAANPERYLAAFATATDPQMTKSGVICASTYWHEPALMPASFEAALLARGTEDLYHCWMAKKLGGTWVIQLD